MRKRLKILVIICIICIYGIFFTSCEYIDELRSNHAVYIQEDGETKILKDGKTYVELVGVRQQFQGFLANVSGYVAEEDVPILLVEIYGDKMHYNIGDDLISTGNKLYCSEDMYDYYIEYYEKLYLDCVCVEVFNSDKQEWVYRMFEEDEAEVIYSAMKKKRCGEGIHGIARFIV